jgi:hypothetical protein
MIDSHSTSAAELTALVNKTRATLLCNKVVNNSIRLVNRLTGLQLAEDSLLAIALVTILLAACFYVTTTALSYLCDRSIPLINAASILVSILAAFSFSIVKGLHDSILAVDKNSEAKDSKENGHGSTNFVTKLISLAPEKTLLAMSRWWKSFLSLGYQYAFVGVCGGLGFVTLWVFGKYTSIHFHVGSYLLMIVCGVALGQGGYCAIRIPRLAKAITIAPIEMFWLHPADSLWVKETSSVFTKLSFANALIATCCIIGLIWPRPWKSSMPSIVASIWLLLTLAVVLYSFLYPHYHLGKAIRDAKKREMGKIQALISFKKEWVAEPNGGVEIEKLNELIKVYDQLAASRDSAIDMRARLSLFFSLAIPILSFVGIIIQIGSVVTNYLGSQRNP